MTIDIDQLRENFEDAIDELVTDYRSRRLPFETIVSSLELKLMALQEEGEGGDDEDAGS